MKEEWDRYKEEVAALGFMFLILSGITVILFLVAGS
jgi:hypothetical protein